MRWHRRLASRRCPRGSRRTPPGPQGPGKARATRRSGSRETCPPSRPSRGRALPRERRFRRGDALRGGWRRDVLPYEPHEIRGRRSPRSGARVLPVSVFPSARCPGAFAHGTRPRLRCRWLPIASRSPKASGGNRGSGRRGDLLRTTARRKASSRGGGQTAPRIFPTALIGIDKSDKLSLNNPGQATPSRLRGSPVPSWKGARPMTLGRQPPHIASSRSPTTHVHGFKRRGELLARLPDLAFPPEVAVETWLDLPEDRR